MVCVNEDKRSVKKSMGTSLDEERVKNEHQELFLTSYTTLMSQDSVPPRTRNEDREDPVHGRT